MPQAQPNTRLVLPYPQPKSFDEIAANNAVLTFWAQNFVVNQIIAGNRVQCSSQFQGYPGQKTSVVGTTNPYSATATGPYSSIVTINAIGGGF